MGRTEPKPAGMEGYTMVSRIMAKESCTMAPMMVKETEPSGTDRRRSSSMALKRPEPASTDRCRKEPSSTAKRSS